MKFRNDLEADYVRGILDYEPLTGCFRWKIKIDTVNVKIGDIAGHIKVFNNGSIYIVIGIKCKTYLAHRLAWLHFYGEWPKGEIDHKDRNGTNNAIANLRDASRAQNQFNSRKRNGNNNYKGVTFEKSSGTFAARIRHNGKRVTIGRFHTEEMAASAYQEYAKRIHGEFYNDGSTKEIGA